METRTFYKNQRELACSLNSIIDSYWSEQISEQKMIELISKIYKNNDEKILKNGSYTKILLQQCGKKRINLISKIINDK